MVNETHQEGPQKGQRKEFDAKCVNQLLELTDDLKRAIDDGHEPHIKVTVLAISNILNQTENVPTAVSKQYSSLDIMGTGFLKVVPATGTATVL